MAKKKLGSTKRFGVRYGRTGKHKLAKLEKDQKSKKECPYCHYKKIKQQTVGIFVCDKCNAKFTAKAYTL